MLVKCINMLKKNGYEMKDQEHYSFEAIMNILGLDIWKHYNNFLT